MDDTLPRPFAFRAASPGTQGCIHGMLLGVIASALLLTRLSCPLLEPEETRYAEIPRQMLAEGRFLEPVWHGQAYYQKPPLLYWLVMLSYELFGIHDWAARLVPALASLATVFVTWLWGRRILGPRLGFAGAIVLILSNRFVYLGRVLTIDPLLSLWVTAALATAHMAVQQRPLQRWWWLASGFLTGLGLLTKGPVAVVLTLVPVVSYLLLDRRCARPSPRSLALYLAVAVAVAGPWYVAMAVMNPEAAGDFFWLHHVQRYLDPLDHEEPIWFFLPWLAAGTLPWSLVLVPIAWRARHALAALVGRKFARPEWTTEPGPETRGLAFALLAFGWCVVFFSLSGCKRPVYILPALPWLALILGCCWCSTAWHGMRCRPGSRAGAVCAATVFILLLIGVYIFLPGYHRRFALRGQVRRFQDSALEVFCYPKRWDSVTFYLQRTDVRVFKAEQRASLVAALQTNPKALLFVKTQALPEFLAALPPSLEFAAVGRQGHTLSVGVVVPRQNQERTTELP
jgi:4-amino-4-deoxy-L-arabinose transferase-like glycosyltransferase